MACLGSKKNNVLSKEFVEFDSEYLLQQNISSADCYCTI
jgi:hypothetical protein